MPVLTEILDWSEGRPKWQRDALRRLMLNDVLSENDILALTEICKSIYGLAPEQEIIPLSKDHIPDNSASQDGVTLGSIFHHRGVNALAEGQTLNFSAGLTVVYGDNGAGKTGYIRILKSACRARGQESILGNVVSGSTPHTPSVSIKYKIGDESDDREWTGDEESSLISRVSVFDTQSASVYLTEKTDVAFRPFGLDLFDRLVRACKAVKKNLENEQRTLYTSEIQSLLTTVPEGTAAASFISNITSLTKPESVEAISILNDEEKTRLELLEKSLKDLQTNDPQKLSQQLSLKAGRIRNLVKHLQLVESALSEDSVSDIFNVRKNGRSKSEEAKRLREATFPENLIEGTGSDQWKTLWEAAKHFSDELAYPDDTFPVIKEGSRCVLCQQDISDEAAERLRKFQGFAISTTEVELRACRENFSRLRKGFAELQTTNTFVNESIDEISLENSSLAESITAAITNNENRRKIIVKALEDNVDLPNELNALIAISHDTSAFVIQIDERTKALGSNPKTAEKEQMFNDVQEFRARNILGQHKELILKEIERKQKLAAYELCLNDTKRQSITQKSTSVTKNSVTQTLKSSFQDELQRLGFKHVEVELKEAGGSDGVLYHKLILTRAPGVELPRVVSEGEQRCLSIAAFFAELSTADDPSGIVFDDPVSSLDYKWREGVAQRLVLESKNRQVIVFTHDIVFLLLIKEFSHELQVEQFDQHVRQLTIGAGVCAEELPWAALPVKKKIGHLKNKYQEVEKLHRDGHLSAHEKETSYLYGLLREAWERALEEVLLGGIVERYRPGVQTQQIRNMSDITEEDCQELESAMTKCSKWLPGHDQAAAAKADIPEPATLKSDIELLEGWVSRIRKRRN